MLVNLPLITKCKRQRKSLYLEVKLDIIKRHHEGQGVNYIANCLGLSHSTVSTVLTKKNAILEAGANVASFSAKTITKARDRIMEEMERLLILWVEDQNRLACPCPLTSFCKRPSKFSLI